MTRRWALFLATGGSAALLLGAFAFQHIGGLAPCQMCLWQRYPHVVAMAAGALALALPGRLLPLMGALAMATGAGIGIFHVGVEQGWWQGPSTCSGGSAADLSADALFDQIMAAPLVRCDEIAWQLAGISMAGWNALLSVALMLLWLHAARRVQSVSM
ncbi:disulfide bond formation protein B [uncultured Roseobacter sp.]|uniref:disulfide bond formation protein B n=1 Tax=uncultured Roseobacter sp. TaxID=114847 RepID=UPI00261BB21F|nr:disulfide bond formation protein B [uncultured Roseobacter sp.]